MDLHRLDGDLTWCYTSLAHQDGVLEGPGLAQIKDESSAETTQLTSYEMAKEEKN